MKAGMDTEHVIWIRRMLYIFNKATEWYTVYIKEFEPNHMATILRIEYKAMVLLSHPPAIAFDDNQTCSYFPVAPTSSLLRNTHRVPAKGRT